MKYTEYENQNFDEMVAIYGLNYALVVQTAQTKPAPQPVKQVTTKDLQQTYKKFPCFSGALPLGQVIAMRGVNERGCRD